MPRTVHMQVLARAAELLGGHARLRAYLRASIRDLEAWMSGAERTPSHVFLRAVDLISAPADASEPLEVQRKSFLVLEHALAKALEGTEASRGNVQLVSDDHLCIVAQRGFERPFLDFFAQVRHDGTAACGRALERAQRVIVPDVATDPIFVGTAAADVLQAAGVAAVQSTPLVDRAGEVIGMLSTHYERPHQPSPGELALLDDLARRSVERLLAAL